ncbi:MAG: extracellular solute-binding protein, partial [Lachnospiraceae bacterium]|nr:extracellular solute-binding protein [Lachnospiraceae bacterium]
MKKRILALVLALVMAVGVVGCGKPATSPTPNNNNGTTPGGDPGVTQDQITLTFWSYEDKTTATLMAEKFMEKYPNIKVETYIIEDMSTDLSAAAASNSLPDVFEGTDSDTALANQYWLDISEYFDADPENANLMTTVKEYGIGCFDTKARYAVPMMFWPSAVFIDRNVIEKLNLEMPRTDWTWA